MKPEEYRGRRWACDVLEEMRQMSKFRNYSRMDAAIEELQDMYYNMERALGDRRMLKRLRKDIKKAQKEHRKLRKQNDKLKEEKNNV